MTFEHIYSELVSDLKWQLFEINMEWDYVAARLHIENHDGYGIVVWCYSEGDERCWLVSIRENFSDDDWGNEILEELTQTDSWEELEETVTKLLMNFYNRKEVI